MTTFDRADESLNRTAWTVRGTELAEKRVCYALWSPEPGILCGVRDILGLIDRRCKGPVTVRGKSDGNEFPAGEVVLTIEGPFRQLVVLESECAALLSLSAGAASMASMVAAAAEIPVIDLSPYAFPPELHPRLACAAAIGGAHGTCTRAGHAAVHALLGQGEERIRVGDGEPRSFYLYGAVPHALTAVFGDAIDGANAWHESYPQVPLTVPLSFDGREKETCKQAVERFGDKLAAVLYDTADHRVIQGGHATRDRAFEMRVLSETRDRQAAMNALDTYGFGNGITIEGAYIIRDLLDSIGADEVSILLGGDITPEKLRAFKAADAPMDGIATATWVRFGSFQADIIRVFEEDRWVRRCRAGRGEAIIEPDLPVLLTK